MFSAIFRAFLLYSWLTSCPSSAVSSKHRFSTIVGGIPQPSGLRETRTLSPPLSQAEIAEMSLKKGRLYQRRNRNTTNLVQKLITKLFENYNKEAVLDIPIVIHMDVLLLQVKSTIEKEGIFESVIALLIEWKDSRMRWDPVEYNNLTFLSLNPDQVWLPDIAMTNSADHLYSISRDSRFTVRVTNTGSFKFVPTGTAKTWCDLKLMTFPFDIQKCTLEFESWSLDTKTMTFDGKSDLLVDDSFASTQFYLCNHKSITYHHTYHFAGETFSRVRFMFIVKRKSTFYVINLIFPIMILSFIQTLTFLIPSRETTADRIAFGTTNMLTLVVFQTIVTEEMPKTSNAVTALSKYIISLILMSAIGIIESVIVERLQNRKIGRPPFLFMRILKPVPTLMRETETPPVFDFPIRSLGPLPEDPSYAPQLRMGPDTVVAKRCTTLSNEKQHLQSSSGLCLKPKHKREWSLRHSGIRPSMKRRRLRRHHQVNEPAGGTRAGEDEELWLALSPATLWSQMAYKIDFLTLILCTLIACFAPVFMFLPLIYNLVEDNECTQVRDG